MSGQLYEIKAKVKLPRGGREMWIKIGMAKSFDKGGGKTGISCHITSVPLNWDGGFCLWPAQDRPKPAPPPPHGEDPSDPDDIPF